MDPLVRIVTLFFCIKGRSNTNFRDSYLLLKLFSATIMTVHSYFLAGVSHLFLGASIIGPLPPEYLKTLNKPHILWIAFFFTIPLRSLVGCFPGRGGGSVGSGGCQQNGKGCWGQNSGGHHLY